MNHDWLIIPDFNHIKESLELSEQYETGFEYNDFFNPEIYSDEEEIKRRIAVYKGLSRNMERDTLHGVFLDISVASRDEFVKKYSVEKVEQSVQIATELGVKGVVFHTGLIGGLMLDSYIEHWLDEQEALLRKLLEKYPVDIYMENTFETTPEALLRLQKRLTDENRFALCLDYGHAHLTQTPVEQWMSDMAEHIGHIHLNDNDGKADLHLAPGDGVLDIKKFSRLLEKYQIKSPVLLEISGVEKQRKALEYMNAL